MAKLKKLALSIYIALSTNTLSHILSPLKISMQETNCYQSKIIMIYNTLNEVINVLLPEI